jgi:hypothetical protein
LLDHRADVGKMAVTVAAGHWLPATGRWRLALGSQLIALGARLTAAGQPVRVRVVMRVIMRVILRVAMVVCGTVIVTHVRMEVGVFMAIVRVRVVVCVIGCRALQDNVEVRPANAAAKDGLGLQFVVFQRQFGQFAAQVLQIEAQIEQRADEHIAGDTGEWIQVEHAMGGGCGHDGLPMDGVTKAPGV